jgi:hypothetical protein
LITLIIHHSTIHHQAVRTRTPPHRPHWSVSRGTGVHVERHVGGSRVQEIIMILKIDFKIKLHHDRVDVCCPHMAKCRLQASKGVA